MMAITVQELLIICTSRWMDDIHVRIIRAGLVTVAFRFPAAVSVNKLCQIGRFLGVARDEFVLQ